LKKSTNSLSKIAHFSSKIGEWETRMKSQLLELEDINQEIAQFVDSIEINPEKLLLLTEKVDNFKRIAKKHNLDTQEELLQFQKSLENDLSNTDELENELIQLEKQKKSAWEKVIQLSAKLSEARKKSIPTIVQEMKPLLAELKLPDSQIDFKLTPKAIPDRKGMETVDLLFSPNKGIAPQMIEKSASGGELGRFMLVVQTLLSDKKQLPSIVFDEIDTGVSGDVADRLGKMLRKMGVKRQLFAITHLPQVAASGNHHIKVSKLADNSSTVTQVEKLNHEQRIVEIAQLMSGEKINDAALENARLLINEQ
jgi:DNA repair protein RecN (Recombination protein N)